MPRGAICIAQPSGLFCPVKSPGNINIRLFASPEYRAWCEAQDQGTPENSVLAARTLIREFPNCPSAWLCHAETWWCHGADDSALFGYEKALELAEADRGQALDRRHSVVSGEGEARNVGEGGGESGALLGLTLYESIIFSCAWHGIGRICEEKEDQTRARAAYENAVSEMPGHDQSWERLIELYRAENDFRSLVKAYRENIRRDYKLADSWAGLAEAVLLAGRPVAAIGACRSAIRYGRSDPDVWLLLARAYEFLAIRAADPGRSPRAGQMQLGFDKDVFYSQARTSCRRAMEAGAANDDVLEFYARLTC